MPWTAPLALSFDDVLLVPQSSDVLPNEVDPSSDLGQGIQLKMPILSSAMDTVTEAKMARGMALLGGMGVIHKNLSPDDQAEQVRRARRAPDDAERQAHPHCSLAEDGALRCGAAIGPGAMLRAEALVKAGVDVLVLDTAHGHSAGVLRSAEAIRARWPDLYLVIGNVATQQAARACVEAGASAVKVGVGPGSICTTRVVTGVGVPQLSAIIDCVQATRPHGIPLIADGGVRGSADMAKALAAGAEAVMVGSLLAGTDLSPGELIEIDGQHYKTYRGMGSLPAMRAGAADRYFQDKGSKKLVAEGVVAKVLYRGTLDEVTQELLGGLRSSMGYQGSRDLRVLHQRARFVQITTGGLRESHVHDVKQ